ncbi:MAG: leucine-rich repeat protein [Clostridia bacterium]|nr:leucine-rich repeat protein [Clostridia bacterium]
MMTSLGLTSFAQDDISELFTYKINNDAVTITDIVDKDKLFGDIVIPDTVDGYPVAAVDCSFASCKKITSLTVSNGDLIVFDGFGFYDCTGLESVTVSNGNLIVYSGRGFEGCTSLESVTVNNGDMIVSDGWSFYGCSALKNITVGDGDVVFFDGWDFYGCENLKKITIGNGDVLFSAGWGFEGCPNIENITIGDGALGFDYYLAETEFYKNAANWTDGVLYIGNHLICAKDHITSCEIREGTLSIEENAFYDCDELVSVTIPSGVTNIGEGAFASCKSLKNVELPEGLKFIGNSAFSFCYSLTDINIPDSVKYIGDRAFEYCENITNVSLSDGLRYLGENAFDGCHYLQDINIPVVESKKYSEFTDSNGNGKIVYDLGSELWNIVNKPDGEYVEDINYSFEGNVIFSEESTFIADYNLSAATNVECVFIPETVVGIGDFAFVACCGLTDVYYGGSEAEWKNMAISYGNSKLDSVTIHYNSTPEDMPEYVPEESETPTDEPITPPEEPTAPPEVTTQPPEETTVSPEEPTVSPEDTTIPPESSTKPPEEPTAPPDGDNSDNELLPYEGKGINIWEHGVIVITRLYPRDIRESVDNEYIYVHTHNGDKLDENSFVGTGCMISVGDEQGNIYYQYEVCVKADINGDGKVTAADARLALRAAARIDVISGVYAYAADADGNGTISAGDARAILRKAAGLDESDKEAVPADFDRMSDLLADMIDVEFDYETADTAYVVDHIIHDYLFIVTYYNYFNDAESDGCGYTDPLGKLMFYYKVPAENVRWICENIYQVEFDENYVSSEGKSYCYDGYVYIEFAQAGYGCDFGTEIDDYKLRDDGKYEVTASFYVLPFGYMEYNIPKELQYRLKVVAEWKQIDGKYDWVFYSVEKIDTPDFDRMADLLTNMFGNTFDYKTADTAYVVDYIIHSDLFIPTYEAYFNEDTYISYGEGNKISDPLNKLSSGAGYPYYKIPAENIKWICENIYQIEFDANYISNTGESYCYGDYVYIECPQTGYGPFEFKTEIIEYRLLDNGKYEISAYYYESEDFGSSFELECRLKVIAEWKQIDGKYDWVFYNVDRI